MKGLKQLRQKLPGFERSMGQMIHEMVNHESMEHGCPPKKVHGWIEVRQPPNPDPVAIQAGCDWIAFLHARVIGGETYTIPVIPDEHNPRPDKIVRAEDKPHVFAHMFEAEQAANRELPGLVAYINSKLV